MRILENCLDIVERAIRFQGCWFSTMLPMGRFTSTYIVVSKFLNMHVYLKFYTNVSVPSTCNFGCR
jgi:hypothetical protein